MPQLRTALAQINPTVGAIEHNADLVVTMTRHAADRYAHLVVFPGAALTGHPLDDLSEQQTFVDAAERAAGSLAARLDAEGLGSIAVVVGHLSPDPNSADPNRADPNRADPDSTAANRAGAGRRSLAVLYGGRVVVQQMAHRAPADHFSIARLHGADVALALGEDVWPDSNCAVSVYRESAPGVLVVLDSQPYRRAHTDQPLERAQHRARQAGTSLVEVNLVGGQDAVVHDGASLVVGADGSLLGRAPQFSDGCLIVDLDLPVGTASVPERFAPADEEVGTHIVRRTLLSEPALPSYPGEPGSVSPALNPTAATYTALVTGLRDYARKNGFESVVLGLSGGLDSAVVAAVAIDALGADKVHGISMPSTYSSEHSRTDAAAMAEATGLNYREVPIAAMVGPFIESLGLTGLAEENVQARVRGIVLMGISNQEGHLVLATGNKSEVAVGYSTIYGDTVGGYAPLVDVPKTHVAEIARWRNAAAVEGGDRPPIPSSSIEKAPSAELRPGQQDADSLPDYALLDALLEARLERGLSGAELVAEGFPAPTVQEVLRMMRVAEWKRQQYAIGPQISEHGFVRDRRMPVTNGWRERM